MMKVAVAIITDENNRILVTQRAMNVPQGGFWEFPGGKLEPQETPEQAMQREIQEELGIEVKEYSYLGHIEHQYPDKLVQLIVFHVSQFTGVPVCLAGQLGLQWLARKEFDPEQFPKANCAIFELLNLV